MYVMYFVKMCFWVRIGYGNNEFVYIDKKVGSLRV